MLGGIIGCQYDVFLLSGTCLRNAERAGDDVCAAAGDRADYAARV